VGPWEPMVESTWTRAGDADAKAAEEAGEGG
jgi:hypothetical protein